MFNEIKHLYYAFNLFAFQGCGVLSLSINLIERRVKLWGEEAGIAINLGSWVDVIKGFFILLTWSCLMSSSTFYFIALNL